jgi:mRNA interferase RelE/StbE
MTIVFRGLTQQALSDASGVNRVQIANIEAGTASGSVATLAKLATALGVAIDDLV